MILDLLGNKTVKITKDMKLAMARYYLKPNEDHLQAVKKLAEAAGMTFSASPSEGWFRFEFYVKRVGHLSTCVIYCDVDNFLDGGCKMVYAPPLCGNEY